MKLPDYKIPQIPSAPRAIQKGVALKDIINDTSVAYLAKNLSLVDHDFDTDRFIHEVQITADLGLMARAKNIAKAMFVACDRPYEQCAELLVQSLTPIQHSDEEFGLAGFFYLPHSFFIANYGIDKQYNAGKDPLDVSLCAQYQLTQRFTAEFCIREFLIQRQDETLAYLLDWTKDNSSHVRRLCSEGTRPKLPWGKHLKAFIKDPEPTLPILDILKDDASLYVRRSVANHLGDIAKSQLDIVLDICERWLVDASTERKWLIRHALRYPDKKGDMRAHKLRQRAK